jgi:hypothetical protein
MERKVHVDQDATAHSGPKVFVLVDRSEVSLSFNRLGRLRQTVENYFSMAPFGRRTIVQVDSQ